MKIKFTGHQATDRDVEFSKDDQVRLFEIMKQEFIEHITYARFTSDYPTDTEQKLYNFCNNYGVDIKYSKDRIAFFMALIKEMKYQ